MATISPSPFPESGQRKLSARETLQRAKACMVICFLVMTLAACSEDERIGVSEHAYNHTSQAIVSILINGEGGVLHALEHGEGGGVCCVSLPKRWRPGLMVTIKWQLDGDWLRDDKDKEVIRDGKKVLVPGPWKEKNVEVPEYSEEMGTFFIHFFPNDEVKVLVNKYLAGNRNHPLPHPSGFKRED